MYIPEPQKHQDWYAHAAKNVLDKRTGAYYIEYKFNEQKFNKINQQIEIQQTKNTTERNATDRNSTEGNTADRRDNVKESA